MRSLRKEWDKGQKKLKKLNNPKNNRQEEQSDDDNKEEAGNYNEAVVEASQEFFANDGQLSEETYKKLEQVGLPRDLVDSYAAGQQASVAIRRSSDQRSCRW